MARGHGGKRRGAGAKPQALSEGARQRQAEAIAKAAEEEGVWPEDILADIVVRLKFKEGLVGIREWYTGYSLYLDTQVVKSTHKQIDVEITKKTGFAVLPEIKRPKDEEIAKA